MTAKLGKFCHACQAIPKHGYCNLPGCPTGYQELPKPPDMPEQDMSDAPKLPKLPGWPLRICPGDKFIFCSPRLVGTEGADHTGQDFFLRCPSCRRRTACHVEGYEPTHEIRAILKAEWRASPHQDPGA